MLALLSLPVTTLGDEPDHSRVDARVVQPEFRTVVSALRVRTALPIVVPSDIRWARTTVPLIGCFARATARRYWYFIEPRETTPKCESDVMFFYATVNAEPWSGPFESFGRHVDLGRGVDGDLSYATGFDDPGFPRADSLTWHIASTRYHLNVWSGNIVALARSIVANTSVSEAQGLRNALPVARVAANRIEPGLAEGVAILRRLTPTAIFVPRAPAIDASVRLFPQGQGEATAGYRYFLCGTVACEPNETVAEVSVSRNHTSATEAMPNVDLACGVRGSFRRVDETNRFATVAWRDRGLDFSILSARDNPSHTDIVRLARSIVANACTGRRNVAGRR